MAAAAAQQPDPGQPKGVFEWSRRHAKWILLCIGVCFVLAVTAIVVYFNWLGKEQGKEPLYHVAVDAVTGLDQATDLARPALEPEFNLTISLASRSVTTGWCLERGSTVRLSYRRVELAAGPVPRFCVGPRESGTQGSIFAWGNGVRVPRMFRDALANDLRRGEAELDVALVILPAPGGESHMVWCKAKVAQPAVPHADMGPVSYAHSPSPKIHLF